jgi:hypothetical protein
MVPFWNTFEAEFLELFQQLTNLGLIYYNGKVINTDKEEVQP